MIAIAHANVENSAPPQISGGLHSAFANLAQSLASQLNSVIEKQIKKKATAEVIRRSVSELLPEVLEREFATSFLLDGNDTKVQRAILMHLLTSVDVQSLHIKPVEMDMGDDLTSEGAAKLLRVSRTHVNTLMDQGLLGDVRRTAGGHRRISKAAVMAYKEASKEKQLKGLEAMAEASTALGLYADDLEGVPRRSKR
jgi:excisionase family DNA binding protein